VKERKWKIVLGGALFVLLASILLISIAQYVVYQIFEPFTKFSVTNTMGEILEDIGPSIKQLIEKYGGK
jgi:hypothetical protein